MTEGERKKGRGVTESEREGEKGRQNEWERERDGERKRERGRKGGEIETSHQFVHQSSAC